MPYRSVKFVWKNYQQEYFQPTGVFNYPSIKDKVVRATEYKYLSGQKHHWTAVSREYFRWGGEPYYPVLTPNSQAKYAQIEKTVKKLKNVIFAGRLGKFKYLNMDTAIKDSLDLFDQIIKSKKDD